MRGLDDLGFGPESIEDVFDHVAQPTNAIVLYEPSAAPGDPVEREAWLRAQVPAGVVAVIFLPDNHRDARSPRVRSW